jgi:hypothetical protein
MKYRLVIGKHTRFENGRAVRYGTGDVFEPTPKELVTIGDRLEPVPDAEPEQAPEGEGSPVEAPHAAGGLVPEATLYLIGHEPHAEIIHAAPSEPAEQEPQPAEPKPAAQKPRGKKAES